ncbi:MAG: SOS response-associated peptidase [Caulobacteraceae bacterium]|nr:SOS response-associated peptidase [Caulobacteraceae bacterium]
MCNRYGYLAPISRLVDEFSQVRIPIVFRDGALPNLGPREHIRPTNIAPIIRPLDPADPFVGVELVDARWWLIPFFHRKSVKDWKPMCTNARAETVATTATFREAFRRRRCLVPATHFFEWTGERGSKQMWCFTKRDAEIFCFPGLWDVADTTDGRIESFTIITTAPGPDCEPYHNRQPVILEPDQWATWLDLTADPVPCLRAGLEGVIAVERVDEGDALEPGSVL